jgi:hypothetical protein
MRTRTFLQRWSLAVLMIGAVPPATAAPVMAANDPAVTTVTVRSEQPWTDTGIDVTAGDTVLIQASGMINVFSGKPEFEQTPDGAGPADPDCIAGPPIYGGHWIADGLACWSLIARIGNGESFFVGSHHLSIAEEEGQLRLGVNDQSGAFADNSGFWSARLTHVTASEPADGNVFEQFNQWLNACVEGELDEVDPGCEQAARELARFDVDAIIDCLTGNVGPDWAATCGQEAADVIFEVFKHWLKAKPPRPGT